MHDAESAADTTTAEQRIAQLEARLSTALGDLEESRRAHDRLKIAYSHALEQLALSRRRLYSASAERADTLSEQLVFEQMFAKVKALEEQLAITPPVTSGESIAPPPNSPSSNTPPNSPPNPKKPRPPTGRPNLDDTNLPVIPVEITDPELEGKAERIGFEYSSRLGYERGGFRHIKIARVVYKLAIVPATESETTTVAHAETPPGSNAPGFRFVTTPPPKELFRRAYLAPSIIAYLLVSKFMMGVPFHRLEQQLELQGASLDRTTMSRCAEDVGATLGAIVEAARKHAFDTAFCLSTDATGVCIQPGKVADRGGRGPCRDGHFFVVLADRDHVFFEYQTKHTSAAVCGMFKGFSGYIQADAHTVYDALFDGRAPRGSKEFQPTGPPPIEVGCWSHCRRNFFDAAVCKHTLGLEGVRFIDAIFAADRALRDLAPAQRKVRRDVTVRPLVDAFFVWAKAQHARPRERGLVATALGYSLNQEQPLRRFLDDGRLRPDNNASERALRPIRVGANAWLFFGSDDHASAAANLFSLVASCKLHNLDPETYLAEVIRVFPYWPRDRYLELAPKYWPETRRRLDDDELRRPLGHISVPAKQATEQEIATG